MQERIRKLSDRGEFILITLICFAYFIVASVRVLLLRIGRLELSTAHVLLGIGLELLILFVAGWILQVRGWSSRRLAGPLSWSSLLAGIPLFVGYILLYWFTALTVASIFPGIAKVRAFSIVHTAPPALLLLFFALNSVFEEFAVTGYVISALGRDSAAFAVSASTLIRFLYHVYQGPLASLSILPLGVLFGVVYWRTRNLWPLVVAHTIANIVAWLVSSYRGG
jgi:uncharacterized protein